MAQNDFDVRIEALKKKIKGYNPTDGILCLNLIMKKQYALDIINGKKKVEYRNYSKHYFDRLYDKDMLDMLEKYAEDEDVKKICEPYDVMDFLDPLRVVKTIRFHNYNDTWSLTVECKENNIIALTDPNIDYMHKEFGDTEFADAVKELQKAGVEDRPILFYFALGNIIERENI